MSEAARVDDATVLEGHGGGLAVAVARRHGVDTMFTLSGAHVFPLYDGAVKADPPMRLVDVRHEQTAVFAAEATAKLTRRPGLAVLRPPAAGARARCRSWTTHRCSPRSPSTPARSTRWPPSPPRSTGR